jgi:hypothetical protein
MAILMPPIGLALGLGLIGKNTPWGLRVIVGSLMFGALYVYLSR